MFDYFLAGAVPVRVALEGIRLLRRLRLRPSQLAVSIGDATPGLALAHVAYLEITQHRKKVVAN